MTASLASLVPTCSTLNTRRMSGLRPGRWGEVQTGDRTCTGSGWFVGCGRVTVTCVMNAEGCIPGYNAAWVSPIYPMGGCFLSSKKKAA
jgi:hypothetical protein